MSLTTLPTHSDKLDGSDIERAGEFLHDTPTPETANANPANTTVEFQIPYTEAVAPAGNFVPAPAAPYVPEVNYHAERAEAAVRDALELARNQETEIRHASGAVDTVRRAYLESLVNQQPGN